MMKLFNDLTEKDLVSFMNLRKEFTDLLNAYVEAEVNTLNPVLLEDKVVDLKQFLEKYLSDKYRVSVNIYNLGDTVLLDTEIYSKDYGINIFPHITNKLEITLDKEFYAYKGETRDLYSFSSIYELQDTLKELIS